MTRAAKPMKRSKYGAIKVKIDGWTFDSKLEASRYQQLRLLEKAGVIRDLTLQKPFELCGWNEQPLLYKSARYKNGRKAKYVADFTYTENNGLKYVIEDSKGARTELYKLKKAIMEAMGYTIVETTRTR